MYIINENESKRIDALRAISTIAVVYLHCKMTVVVNRENINAVYCYVEKYLNQLFSFAVPVFLIISAIFVFKKNKYDAIIKSRTKTLLIPYLFWNSFWLLGFVLLGFVHSLRNYLPVYIDFKEINILDFLRYYGLSWPVCNPFYEPLWYVRDMFLGMLLVLPVIMCLKKNNKIWGTVVLLLLVIPFDFFLKRFLVWFLIGKIIVDNEWHMSLIDDMDWKKIIVFFLLVSMGLLLCDQNSFLGSIIYNVFVIVCILMLIKCSKYVVGCKVIDLVKKYSFGIFVWHYFIVIAIRKMWIVLLGNSWCSLIIGYLIVPVIAIILCVFVNCIMYKLFRKPYLFLTGGR